LFYDIPLFPRALGHSALPLFQEPVLHQGASSLNWQPDSRFRLPVNTVLESPHNGFKILTTIGVGSATPTGPGFKHSVEP
jgi:hypothetical protein